MTIRETLDDYIANGINIFPCNRQKQPLCQHGFKEATIDKTQINAWWSKWPEAGIGVPTGKINNIIVLDVDKDADKFIDGEITLQSFPALPITRTVRTPRGGRHLYFSYPGKTIKNSTSKIGEGLDIRGDGGYVIVPPSSNGNGKEYILEVDEPPATLPEWLLNLIIEPERQKSLSAPTPLYTDVPDRMKIEDALSFISPDCHYDEWVKIGMALHSWNPAEGRYLWDAWSRKSQKYEEGLIDVKWKSFKTGAIKINTLFGKAKDAGWKPYRMAPVAPGARPKNLAIPTEDFYYSKHNKEYLVCNSRKSWISLAENQFRKELLFRGMDNTKQKGQSLSEIDLFIIGLRDTKDIDYAGPLAGYSTGFYETNGYRVLVTESPTIIAAAPGEWPTINAFLRGLLFDENYPQEDYLFGWLKLAYESLLAGHRRPGQALVICGPHDCGKSLLQLLITKALGGRSAKPYAFMTATTDFNSELFTAEHLCIEDEPAGNDLRLRRAFGAQIKQITGCDTQRCHPKHQQAITLSPFWRLSITLNNEAENLMVLPPIDDSIEDKLIMLKAFNNPMPMPSETDSDRTAFWNKLVSELPNFLHFLVNWKIPDTLRQARYGISFFHHPEILREIDALSPEFRLLNIIDKCLFGTLMTPAWTGTAEDLEVKLTSEDSFQYETRKLLSWNNACGTYLGRLSRKFPTRFMQKRTERNRIWTIEPPV